MNDRPSILEDAIEALSFARQGTIAEANNIPDDRWDYRPHPKSRTVSELVKHMLESAAMLAGEAADRDGDFQRRQPQEHMRAHAGDLPESMTPGELHEALDRLHNQTVARIRAAGEGHMATAIRRFDGGSWSRITYVFYAAFP